LNVYFIPLAGGRFEPYFEHEEVPEAEPVAADQQGFFARLVARFSAMIKEAEEQRHQTSHDRPSTTLGRLRRALLGWVAEQVAEQRLLWRLRNAERAELHVPEDLNPDEALRRFREGLQQDADKHRLRLALHLVGLLISAPFAIVPGPNLFGYFFTFTVVGHFMAFRGARRGLNVVTWSVVPNPELTTIGRAVVTAAPERYRIIHDAAARLRLAHLARFVERMAAPPA
jgi:hypothetical protein